MNVKYSYFVLNHILESFEKEDVRSILFNVGKYLEDFSDSKLDKSDIKILVKELKPMLKSNGLKCRWKDTLFIEIVRNSDTYQYPRKLSMWG